LITLEPDVVGMPGCMNMLGVLIKAAKKVAPAA
jgi:hypothetical protein